MFCVKIHGLALSDHHPNFRPTISLVCGWIWLIFLENRARSPIYHTQERNRTDVLWLLDISCDLSDNSWFSPQILHHAYLASPSMDLAHNFMAKHGRPVVTHSQKHGDQKQQHHSYYNMVSQSLSSAIIFGWVVSHWFLSGFGSYSQNKAQWACGYAVLAMQSLGNFFL